MIKKINPNLFLFIFTLLFYSPLHSMENEDTDPPSMKNLPNRKKIERHLIKKLEGQIPDLAFEIEPEKVKKLAWIFNSLGELYIKHGDNVYVEDQNKAANFYNKAALFYNYIISMVRNNEYLKGLNEMIKPCDQLNSIQSKLVHGTEGNKEKLEKLNPEQFPPYKLLMDLRQKVRKKIEHLGESEETYVENTRALFQEMAQGMKDFIVQLYKKAEEVIGYTSEGNKPEYAVIGLGSMAMQQITPYSDLEFAILIGDQGHRDYLKKLSQLVHFYVINLGESILPPEQYKGCNTRHLVRKAVNFDLGGKTPLGMKGKFYDLVCTVDQMLKYMYNKDQKSEHIDETLPFILQKTCFVHGNKALFDKYDGKVKEFLKVHGESRAVKILWEGCTGIDYTDCNRREHKTIGNLNEFALRADESAGRRFDIKKDIYRIPDRFIYNLGLIYGIDAEDNWDVITQLADNEIINNKAAHNLKQALTFATNFRLKAYSHSDEHIADIDYDEEYSELDREQKEGLVEQNLVKVFKLNNEDLQKEVALLRYREGDAFFKYYYVTIPLTRKIEFYCKLEKDLLTKKLSPELKKAFFQKELFYDDGELIKAEIYLRLSNPTKSLEFWKAAGVKMLQENNRDEENNLLGEEDNLLFTHRSDLMGIAYASVGDYKKAIQCHEEALKTERSVENLCSIYNHLGIAWQQLGDYQKSYEYFVISKKKQKQNRPFGESNPTKLIIDTYDHLGVSLFFQYKLEESLKYIEKSLRMSEQKFGKCHNLTLPHYFKHIEVLRALGKGKDTLCSLNNILNIRKKFFSKDYSSIANIYYDIGEIYREGNQNKQAFENYQDALKIWEEKLGINHPDAALGYNKIAFVYRELKDYDQALLYCKKGLCTREEKLGEDHSDTISSYVMMADILNKKAQYKQALIYCRKALGVMERALNKDYPNIASAYEIMSDIYSNQKRYDKALSSLEKELENREKRWGKNNLHTAETHYKIAAILCYQNKYKEALGPSTKALQIQLLEKNLVKSIYSCKLVAEIFKQLKYGSKAKILQSLAEKIEKDKKYFHNEKHFYLRECGETDEETIEIIVAIASELNRVSKHVLNYKKVKPKIETICKKYNNKSNQEIVRMLCFEAICLGVADGNLNTKNALYSLKQFCQENLNLVKKIALIHPEYFVEKTIVEQSIGFFPEQFKDFKSLL